MIDFSKINIKAVEGLALQWEEAHGETDLLSDGGRKWIERKQKFGHLPKIETLEDYATARKLVEIHYEKLGEARQKQGEEYFKQQQELAESHGWTHEFYVWVITFYGSVENYKAGRGLGT